MDPPQYIVIGGAKWIARMGERYGGDILSYQEIAKGGRVLDDSRTVSITSALVEYQTGTHHVAHIDCPGHVNHIKNMITGAAQMDCAILVVDADEGSMPQTLEHFLLAWHVDVPHMIVFLNKCDLVNDSNQLQRVEDEVRGLLSKHYKRSDFLAFVRGSALRALQGEEESVRAIEVLMEAIDNYAFSMWTHDDRDRPFLMPIKDVFSIEGYGTVVTGRIKTGTIHPGDEVGIYGFTAPRFTAVSGLEVFHKSLDEGLRGDYVGCLLSNIAREEIKRGQCLATAYTEYVHSNFECVVYVLKEEEGGRHNPFFNHYMPQFYVRTANATGRVALPEDIDMVKPGDEVRMTVQLIAPLVMQVGQPFIIREGRRTVGVGNITKILD